MLSEPPVLSSQELTGRGMLLSRRYRLHVPIELHGDRQDRQLRCAAYLATLQLLVPREADDPSPTVSADDVSELTTAILAEAAAATALTVAAAAGARQGATARFLATRLLRLRLAADDAVTAARASDASTLRLRIRRLEALVLALWTVQAAVSSPPDPRQTRLRNSGQEQVTNGPNGGALRPCTIPGQRVTLVACQSVLRASDRLGMKPFLQAAPGQVPQPSASTGEPRAGPNVPAAARPSQG